MPPQPLNRARVEASIAAAKIVFRQFQVVLPPFAAWGIQDWEGRGPEYDEVRDCALGWDVTDFGSKDFPRIGRTLFTLRNGHIQDPRYPKSYAEKFILDPEGQRAPAHFHRTKREDIINRGGGNICVQLTRTDAEDRPAKGAGCSSTRQRRSNRPERSLVASASIPVSRRSLMKTFAAPPARSSARDRECEVPWTHSRPKPLHKIPRLGAYFSAADSTLVFPCFEE
jgi:hypothetical protein